THFVNAGGHVGFQAGAFDRDSHWSVVGDGQVSSADYGTQQGLGVVAVHETATLPSWTLADPTGAPITVTGDALATLRLHLSVPDGWGHLVPALVDFTGSVGGVPGVHAYAMRWRLDAPDTAWRPYCLDGLRQPDAAVFQQDIAVGPVAGEVTQPPAGTTVTLSCLRGAPATVYGWHYPYTGASLFYFCAGIQMKRASYCADERYYTTSGTAIELADDQHIQRGTAGSDHVRYLEAGWTAAGATCVDLANLRHSAMGFTGSCAGHALPSCPADPTSTPYLIAGPQAPAP
ncbi:MAG TPA: ADYC domain-containing protein, partial [Kofleriaceae bacterium]